MKIYTLWMEGYSATVDRAPATYLGKFSGDTFRDAVERWSETLTYEQKQYFNLKTCTYWGCNIYDNERDARKYFG